MRQHHPTTLRQQPGTSPLASELSAIFVSLDDAPILKRLAEYRWTGRPGWNLEALWRSYVALFVMNMPTVNALLRRLQDDPALREVCGFGDDLPSRWTFNRFIARVSHHSDLVEDVLARLTDRLHDLLPGFGENLSVDSTTVRSHSNPGKTPVSDPEASWIAKGGNRGKKEWTWGYKAHVVADSKWELPLAVTVTGGSVNDVTQFIPPLALAKWHHPWLAPRWITADAGYDARSNYDYTVAEFGAVPIIKLNPRSGPAPKKTVMHSTNIRRHSSIPRESDDWRRIYATRQGVERCFSRLKGHRTLNTHARRGLRKVTLHVLMSVLALQASAVAKAEVGDTENVRHCTRRVA